MEKNPFLDNKNKYQIRKPFQKEQLTEAQKKRNLKGLELVKEVLKKVIPFRYVK